MKIDWIPIIVAVIISTSLVTVAEAQERPIEEAEQLKITATQLLAKSIRYHDPHNNWDSLDATLNFKTLMADKSERKRIIRLNIKEGEFHFTGVHAEGRLEYTIDSSGAKAMWNGSTTIPTDKASKYQISEARAVLFRNYFSYLYGMPMKLRDVGTIIDPTVFRVTFYDKVYDRIRVTYDPAIGTDTWYFYFNPELHALEAYQFYKDESQNDGEYILFEETIMIGGIKIPRIRHWYYNKDQKFLATDVLEK